MASNGAQSERQRRYRRHKSGDHSQCLPDRECRRTGSTAPMMAAAPSLSPRAAMERELGRVIARLDVLAAALDERPLDLEISAEARGLARTLTSLAAALEKLKPPAGVTPLKPNPLEELRARRAARQA